MRRLVAVLLLIGALIVPGAALAQVRDRTLVIAGGQRVTGSVATIDQDIRVDGAVDGDVTSWSGDIVIAGQVGGDVISYAGDVKIIAQAHVAGHVLALSGGLVREDGARVAGQAIGGAHGGALASLFDLFTTTPGDPVGAGAVGRLFFGVVLGVFVLAFCLLFAAFWPQRTATTSLALGRVPLRALALGLLTTALLALLLPPLAALFAATLIGLPVLLLLVLLLHVPYVYGMAALARALGARLNARDLAGAGALVEPATLVSAVALALLVALVAVIAPLWGVLLFYLLASPGLGAAIFSRGGLLVPAR